MQVPHSAEAAGFRFCAQFLEADNCKAAYAKAHKLLAACCAIITKNGGVARELTQQDWARLRDIPMTEAARPFHASMLD